MRLEDLIPGVVVGGVVPGDDVTVVAAEWSGPDALVLTYRDGARKLDEKILYRRDEAALFLSDASRGRPFDAQGEDFRLAATGVHLHTKGT